MSTEESKIALGQEGVGEGPTKFRTAANRFEVRCGACGDEYYADEGLFAAVNRAEADGLDNPFLCDDCREEYDEIAAEG